MERLSLIHLKNIQNFNGDLIGDFHPFSNKYITEWVRYIKYAFSHKLYDNNFNLHLTKDELKKVSMVYSSDKLIHFQTTLDYLLARDYLLLDSDLYFFNSLLFTPEMFNRPSVEASKREYYTFYNPWFIIEDNNTLTIWGYSDILSTLVPLCIRPAFNFNNDQCLHALSSKLSCPMYLDILNQCFDYFKKHCDFTHAKKIKDFFSQLNNITPSSVTFNNFDELLSFLSSLNSDDTILVTCNNLFNNLETLVLIEYRCISAIFPITPSLRYEIYSTAIAMKNLNVMHLLLESLSKSIPPNNSLSESIYKLLNSV